MAINLSRNSKVFFTNNINSTTGKVQDAGFTPNNTFEVQVLDGFSFGQNTNSEAVTISETGTNAYPPSRGQRSFNTSLAPADFSFSSYIRPYNTTTKVTAEESILWNALLNANPINATAPSVVLGTGGSGTITGAPIYASGGLTITVTGTSLPSGVVLTAGDTVVLSGFTSTSGVSSAYINTLAILTSFTATQYVVTLVNTPANNAATILAASTITITKVSSSMLNTATVLGTGGSGTITAAAYTYSTATGVASITLTGTSLPTIATVGTIYTLTGITATPTTSTPSGATASVVSSLNTSVYLAAAGDSTTSSLKLTYASPDPAYTSLTWTGSPGVTLSLLKSSWGENSLNSFVSTTSSDQQRLQSFGMLFLVDNVMYAIDNCALNQVTVDFGIDQITTAQWTGQGAALRKIADGISTDVSANILSNAIKAGYFTGSSAATAGYGAYTSKNASANFITNKLTAVTLTSINTLKDATGTATSVTAGGTYSVAATGGTFTVNNNVTYLTPNNVSTVNTPCSYFVGTRAITGSVTAYLRTGSVTNNDTGALLDGILDATSTSIEPMFGFVATIGGSTAPYLKLALPTVFLQVPTVDIQQVVSTSIGFTAEGSSVVNGNTVFDILKSNEGSIKYYA